MKINITDINTIKKLLEKVPYQPNNEKSKIFFEIDCGKVVDDGSFVMEIKDKNTGSSVLTKPGLVLSVEKLENKKIVTYVELAYALVDYAPKFNLDAYLDILNIKMNSKHRQILTSLDAYLVKCENILSTFDI